MLKNIRRRSVPTDSIGTLAGVPPLLERLYLSRGVRSNDELQRALGALPTPDSMLGVEAAVTLLTEALQQRWRIRIVGDFDADGATSSALAVIALRWMGAADVDFIVPNRFEYGYGLTPELVADLAPQEPRLLVTVDNGIASHEGVAKAQQLGMKVLVTDHHLPGETLPSADAIVDPNLPECQFPTKNLAGVGVIFYIMLALRSHLRSLDWFEQQGLEQPNMGKLLDLVALGTVADVVPLDRVNRTLVHQGLQRIRAGQARPGIQAILDVSQRRHQSLVASDLGFAIGPRLNAAGRLDDMSVGINCLLQTDELEARALAARMDELNQERCAIETSMREEAEGLLDKVVANGEVMPLGVCVYEPSWHQGVVGILASRLKDRYHRPVIAFAEADEGLLKGSGRSIPGLHLRDCLALVDARHPGVIERFGGHAMAAGLTVAEDQFEYFQQCFLEAIEVCLDDDSLTPELLTDGELEDDQLTLAMAHQLRDAGPWGQLFAEPTFDGEFAIVQQKLVGQKHLKLLLKSIHGGDLYWDAIAFNVDLKLWPDLMIERVRLVYRLDANYFRGQETVQLMIEQIEAI